jgi:hypothetical protein
MSAASHWAARVVGVVAAAAAVLVAGVVFFAWTPEVTDRPTPAAAVDRPATLEEASTAFNAAAAALQRGDLDGWRTALPVEGAAAPRSETRALPPPQPPAVVWSLRRCAAHPRRTGAVRRAVHRARSARPARPTASWPIACSKLWRAGSRTVVVDDLTPPPVKDQYLMAFNRPVVVKGERCLVLAERSWRERARQVAEASAAAHSRLDLLGLDPSRTTLIFVYASQTASSTGARRSLPRRSREVLLGAGAAASDEPWWPRDVGVLAPALADAGDWTPLMLAHELTHAYTMRWFEDTAHRPSLLLEGLAVAVEGGRSYEALRQELASGNTSLPLETAFATAVSGWAARSSACASATSMGGSIVLYVLDGWDLATLRDFVRASPIPTSRGGSIDAAMRDSLGVGWDEFVRAGRTSCRRCRRRLLPPSGQVPNRRGPRNNRRLQRTRGRSHAMRSRLI